MILDGIRNLAVALLGWLRDTSVSFTAWILGLVSNLLNGGLAQLLNGLNLPDPPDWLVQAPATVGIVMSYAGALGHWIPWPVAVTVAGFVLVCAVAGLAIIIVRIIASFVSAGGGGT